MVHPSQSNPNQARDSSQEQVCPSQISKLQSIEKPKTSERHPKMEVANRIVSAAVRAVNNNTVISVCLVGSFVALGVRSVNQQKNIEALEAEKDSLIKSNKAMKKAMWDWKQQLFAEADTHEALVPLSRLKAIYGEAPIARNGISFFPLKQCIDAFKWLGEFEGSISLRKRL